MATKPEFAGILSKLVKPARLRLSGGSLGNTGGHSLPTAG